MKFAKPFSVGRERDRFSLHIRSTRKLTINETPIITVIGKATNTADFSNTAIGNEALVRSTFRVNQ